MKTKKPFSIKARLQSFRYAFEGISAAFKTEHNLWIHSAATIAVIIFSFLLKVETTEAANLSITISIVWCAELFNTAIEKLMDRISTKENPSIKLIKDVSAAAVLVTAIAAVVTGSIIFLPKIF